MASKKNPSRTHVRSSDVVSGGDPWQYTAFRSHANTALGEPCLTVRLQAREVPLGCFWLECSARFSRARDLIVPGRGFSRATDKLYVRVSRRALGPLAVRIVTLVVVEGGRKVRDT